MTSSTPGYFGGSSALMRLIANCSVPAMHCTLVLIASTFFVPTEPLGLRKPSKVTVKRSLRGRDDRCEFEFVEFRRRRHRNSRLVHPLSGQDSLRSGTDHLVVTADRAPSGISDSATL